MKRISKLLSRVRNAFAPRQGKKGSSLAFVMMIGAALVVWVMCIMPLMSTTGTAAYQTMGSYDDYLMARSSIEFCKSELEKIVEEKIPYTFAVIGDTDSGFTAIPKEVNGVTLNSNYSARVDYDSLDDQKDVPLSTSAGNEVTAICAVTMNRDNPNIYDITITTYNQGKKIMTYTAIFTPKGSLLIYPEAYKQNQALPLSDFVVVDGKIGPHTIWNSGITMSNASSLDFSETLLPLIDASHSDWSQFYANSGEYPAVFKTTANSAYAEGADITDPVTMGDLASDKTWIMPKAGNSGTAGNIWYYTDESGDIHICLYTTETVDITADCTVYLNGKATYDKKVPETPGVYTVTVDYKGTDYATEENLDKYDGTKVNVLPINGLALGNINKVSSGKHTIPEQVTVSTIEKVEHRDENDVLINTTYTVTLTRPAEDLMYGYVDPANPSVVHWSTSNVITGLDGTPGKAYFFYICRPASFEDGVFMADSDVKSAGGIFVPKFVNKLTDGTKYAIVGQSDGADCLLNNSMSLDAINYNQVFVTTNRDLSTYSWTADQYGGYNWNFINTSNRKYLGIIGDLDCSLKNGNKSHHRHSDYEWKECRKNKIDEVISFDNFRVDLVDDAFNFRVITQDNNFYLSSKAKGTYSYPEYQCAYSGTATYEKYSDKNYYVSLNNSVRATTDYASVKFMELPSIVDTTPAGPSGSFAIEDTVAYGTNVFTHVDNNVEAEIIALYANGNEITANNGILNAGIYNLVANVKIGDSNCWVSLGNLSVTKANLSADGFTVTTATNPDDELRVDVSAEGWHANGGVHYFGYKSVDETDYHWYSAGDVGYTFRLRYGEYMFAVKESGSNNYNGVEVPFDGTVKIETDPVTIASSDKPFFLYTMSDTGDIEWYKLPEGILPGRVHFLYGYTSDYYDSTGTIDWHTEYKGESYKKTVWITVFPVEVEFKLNKFAVYIDNSNYPDKDNHFEIGEPLGYNFVNGHGPSMMRGSSLYFMGRSGSINTHGADVVLTTDLLVLNSDIIGGGSVMVGPYSTGTGTPGDTLLFVSNTGGIVRDGKTIFEGRQFYRVPKNTDLCNLNATTTAGWKIGGTTDGNVKYLFRQGIFPEINMDIAYASNEQLSRIVSSETIGWTDKGVLSGSSSSTNVGYVVTAYITQMDGAVDYKANRVIIAAKAPDGSNTLNVTSDLTFTTRYLSVDADQIVGTGGVKFILNNLAQDENFIQMISSALGLTNYSSKSLQMDYERYTLIISDSGTTPMSSQICRYDSGTNLLGGSKNQSLMAEYSTTEIERLFSGGLSGLASTVKTVDRYVSLKADEGNNTIDIGALAGIELDIYANYIYVDPSVTAIKMSSLFSSDVKISSQESGYTTHEYLGIFKGHSAETYTGTLLYFANTVNITYGNLFGGSKTVSIAPGFYWMAATDSGTSLSVLAENPSAYEVNPEILKDYSVYINPDGSLSNAYVDTGLLDNNNATAGGFSGGSME